MREKNVHEMSLADCMTPQSIERFFQRGIRGTLSLPHYRLRRECSERAAEIAPRLRRGHLLAVRADKGAGNSARYVVAGEQYRTGTWGNGAGYRWAMADFEKWYEHLLRRGGLRSARKIALIIDWVRSDYLWRALRELA